MSIYKINYTDVNKSPIFVNDGAIDTSLIDITLIGKSTVEYGDKLDENLLHLLENFASDEDSFNLDNPNLNTILFPLLSHPIEGQLWFNKTKNRLYIRTSSQWTPLQLRNEILCNSGIIAHGQQIPPLVDQNGYVFSYAECSWFVSPQYVDQQANYIECYTDSNAKIYSRYRSSTSGQLIESLANYLISGVKNSSGNSTAFPLPSIPLIPSSTPTPTPTPTLTPTNTPMSGSTITPTPSTTLTITPTLTMSITPTITLTPTPTLTRTPTITVSQHTFSYILLSQIFNDNLIYNIGYNNLSLNAPAYGNLSPQTYFNYYISCFFEYIIGNPSTSSNISLVFSLTTINGGSVAPNNILSTISFTDNTGTYKIFNVNDAIITTSTYNGNNIKNWTWENVSGIYFNQNANYIISLSN